MTRDGLLRFMRSGRYAVQASAVDDGPQAAVVGIVVSDEFEIFFDTLATSRKAQNLRLNPRIAFVLGDVRDGIETTVQYEGVADEPTGADLDRLKALYFERFPDGRDRQEWPGLIYVRVKPSWIRFSDFSTTSPQIVEFGPRELSRAAGTPSVERGAHRRSPGR